MQVKLRRFESIGEYEKEYNKLIKKVITIVDKRDQEKSYRILPGNIESNYYSVYYLDNKGTSKQLTIQTLRKGNIIYMIYANKAINEGAAIYQLRNIDYIKEFNFKEEYKRVHFKTNIDRLKSNIDFELCAFYSNINKLFEGLEKIQELKQIVLEEYKNAM